MDWDGYRETRGLIEAGRSDDALARIDADPPDGGLRGVVDGLRAWAWQAKGDPRRACAILETSIEAGVADHWTWHRLATCRRQIGDLDGTFVAHQRMHALLGWPESEERGYRFTHDYFSTNIPSWTKWFATIITAAPIRALEIGSWQGGSATWLLDRIVGPRGGTLTCIDTFAGSSEHAGIVAHLAEPIERIFDDNISRTGRGVQLRKLKGFSQDVLRSLPLEPHDFIYVDGAHEAKFVIQDAILAWPLLAVGGAMLFDDVPFGFSDRPEQNTARAIDFFLSVFARDLEVIDRDRQLLLRRIG